jgi:glycosyltransferase involved in cell wall biosynthesis
VAALGHEVTLLCSSFANAPREEIIDGIRVIRRGSRNFFNYTVPGAYAKLRREKQYDIVIDDLNKIPFFTPLFVREPLLTIVHHLFDRSIYLEASFLPASYVYLSEKMVPRVYRHTPFAAVSQSTREELLHAGIKSTIDLLPNAVDLTQYSFAPSLKSSRPLVGYLGRLKRYKSVDHLLRAFVLVRQAVPDAEMVIIGDGDYRQHLQALASTLQLENAVRFTGQVSQEEKVDHLNASWVVVNPSPKEGWGLTVIEANACGVPVIAADSPGLRDSVCNGKTGWLYPYGDVGKLAGLLITMIQDSHQRTQMEIAARQWAEGFSWDASAQQAIEIIKRICR